MNKEIGYELTTPKPFDTVVANLEKLAPEGQFRVLHVHDVKATLAEKGFERGPLKIIEVCNSAFAHQALQKSIDVALFMPCKFSVYTEGGKTHVCLGRPSIISQMLPGSGLEQLAADVEERLKKIMHQAV
ncbi:MAG: DUF302 domain-containing protein [candidate division Zixibacteria bacterium]|nr:DUF302 domain-containing protein [candidate division Zixibacteria bacterium]